MRVHLLLRFGDRDAHLIRKFLEKIHTLFAAATIRTTRATGPAAIATSVTAA